MLYFRWFLLLSNGFFALIIADKDAAMVNMGIVIFITLVIIMDKSDVDANEGKKNED